MLSTLLKLNEDDDDGDDDDRRGLARILFLVT